jgi:putative hydrolase of the HAD superfamily
VFDQDLWPRLDARLGLAPGTCFAAVLGHPLLEEVTRGRADHARWRAAAREELVARGAAVGPAGRAVAEWAAEPGAVEPVVRDGLERLRDAGTPVLVLTNGTDRVPEELDAIGLAPFLGPGRRWLLNTADLGAAKPEREAFARAHVALEERTGRPVERSRVAFLDDSAGHVAAAAAFGWRALRHPGASRPPRRGGIAPPADGAGDLTPPAPPAGGARA